MSGGELVLPRKTAVTQKPINLRFVIYFRSAVQCKERRRSAVVRRGTDEPERVLGSGGTGEEGNGNRWWASYGNRVSELDPVGYLISLCATKEGASRIAEKAPHPQVVDKPRVYFRRGGWGYHTSGRI